MEIKERELTVCDWFDLEITGPRGVKGGFWRWVRSLTLEFASQEQGEASATMANAQDSHDFPPRNGAGEVKTERCQS